MAVAQAGSAATDLTMVFEPGSNRTAEGAGSRSAGRASAGSAAPPFRVRSRGLIDRHSEPERGEGGQDIARVANAQLQHGRFLSGNGV